MEQLDQMLLVLEDCTFSAAPCNEETQLGLEVTSSVQILRNRLRLTFSEQVAQRARENDLDGALEALHKYFPNLQLDNVEEIIQLIYVASKDLQAAIGFVGKIPEKLRRDAFEALYDRVRFKKHTELPEILLLRSGWLLADHGDLRLVPVNLDCLEIVKRIAQGARHCDFSLSEKVILLSSQLLEENMTTIVRIVMAEGQHLIIGLLQYSCWLPVISCKCALIRALFNDLKASSHVSSKSGMHLWVHARCVAEDERFLQLTDNIQERCLAIIDELGNHKDQFYSYYESHAFSGQGEDIESLHSDNWQLRLIAEEFVELKYGGNLENAWRLLAAARNVKDFSAAASLLSALLTKMAEYDQLDTHECFAIFAIVKDYTFSADFLASSNSTKLSDVPKCQFKELQAKTPRCVRLLLWPESPGGFRLVNKFFEAPLFCDGRKDFVLCRPPPNYKDNNQVWNVQVDVKTHLVTFSLTQDKHYSLKDDYESSGFLMQQRGTAWRVQVDDQNHIKISSNGNFV